MARKEYGAVHERSLGHGGGEHKKMMTNMSTYGGQEKPGYKPPYGSAGKEAIGEYSHKHNPLTVPMKGSHLGIAYGNADVHKAMRNKDEQLKKENLRGQAC